MRTKGSAKTVRRSVALPRELVEQVRGVAPPELRENLNRLVTLALQEFAARQKAVAFEEAMAKMAKDPAICSECAEISRDFILTEMDGLKSGDGWTHPVSMTQKPADQISREPFQQLEWQKWIEPYSWSSTSPPPDSPTHGVRHQA